MNAAAAMTWVQRRLDHGRVPEATRSPKRTAATAVIQLPRPCAFRLVCAGFFLLVSHRHRALERAGEAAHVSGGVGLGKRKKKEKKKPGRRLPETRSSPILVAGNVAALADHGDAVEGRAVGAVVHQLRLVHNLPQAHGAVAAAAGHGALPMQAVNPEHGLLMSKERLDIGQLVEVPQLRVGEGGG